MITHICGVWVIPMVQIITSIHVFNGEGSYNVTLTVSDSLFQDCKKEFSSNVNVESFFKLWVPNSFTPNNDGINDFFKPVVVVLTFMN